MSTNIKINSDFKTGVIVSCAVHLLMLLFFVIYEIGFDYSPLPAAEVSFISGKTSSRTLVAVAPSQSPASLNIHKQDAVKKPAGAVENKKSSAPPIAPPIYKSIPITPPKRRMQEREEPILSFRTQDKMNPEQKPAGMSGSGTVPEERPTPMTESEHKSRGENRAQSGSGGGKGAYDTDGTNGQPFSIEGDAAQRVIVKQVIPQYPQGLQQEAVIKFRFTVLPSGRITDLIPMRKGDPTLEQITIQALQTWRFNSLPANMEQKSVQGLITFRYELR